MEVCPECGRELVGESVACPECEGAASPEFEPAVSLECEVMPSPECEVTSSSECDQNQAAGGGSAVSRRGFLVYSGGSALATWAAVGAGWFAFIREPTGPEEDVVREYVDALDRSHYNTAASLFHEDAPGEAWSPQELPTPNHVEITVEETDVVDRETETDTTGVEELALVHADVRIDDGNRSEVLALAFVVAKNEEGEWLLWEDR